MGQSLRYSPRWGNLLHHFVALYVGDWSERGHCWLASGGSLSTCPFSSHFTHFPYATGAPLAVALVLVPRVGEFAYILKPFGPFKQTLLRAAVSSTAPTPTGFYSQKLWGFIFPALEPLAARLGLGLISFIPQVSFPIFIHHTWMWDYLFCRPLPPPHCHHIMPSLFPAPQLCLSYLSGWIWLL